MLGAIAIAVTVGLSLLLIRPALVQTDRWRAIATPLASVIGSGFLVSVPILRDLAGVRAIGPMAGLLLLAYLIGSAVRVSTMKQAQIIAAAVYLSFFALVIPLFGVGSGARGVAGIVAFGTPAEGG
ncbi:hypothetical protein [Breoghania sp. L-A4]|uniref:hypothetical protein n=1 Tax=Breoghania sp. L-A4 TaxID=2304600 RepID=UPI000E35FFFB|nr:hypothetical protein [Breoghania sp. L-A4]AXS41168.1 hypothetical protein D1F64_15470 [Breoghania sp. L-A4]